MRKIESDEFISRLANLLAHSMRTAVLRRPDEYGMAYLTDGATRLVDRFGVIGWQELLDTLASQGPDALIHLTREAENGDPRGERWPRTKRHDDATAVVCRL